MIWTLSSVGFRCTARRLRTLGAQNPAVAVVAAVLAAAAPVAAAAGGLRFGRGAVVAAAADPALARAATLALTLDALLAGAAIVALAPVIDALGPQLAVAPVPRARAVLGLRVLPAVGAAAIVAVPAAVFLVAAVGGSRPLLVAATLLGGLAAFVCGGAAVDAGRTMAAAPVRAGGALCALVGMWIAGAAVTGRGVAVGPLGALPAALARGPAAEAGAAAALVVVTALGCAVWVVAATAAERRRRAGVRVVTLRVPRGALAATTVSALKTYGRHHALRRHAVATVVVAAGAALAAARAIPTAEEEAATVGLLIAIAGAAVYPLAAPALDAPSRWLWRTAPVGRAAVRVSRAAAAVVLAGTVVAAAAAVVTAANGRGGSVASVAAIAAIGFAAATLASVAVPWRADSVVDQAASYTGAAIVAVVLWLGAARLVAAVPGPEGFVGTAVIAAIVAGAVVAAAAAEVAA